ncbi:MAG: hypothetical protein JXR25_13590 [Pontiellaceae bacterium]|nr:hypothetical protein [Pontiellaceae bacterium]MBN2785849.1 hypothetical protein [Pontiellaceae bacterium]
MKKWVVFVWGILAGMQLFGEGVNVLSLHFEKEYQIRNYFNSSVPLSRLDLGGAVAGDPDYPLIHLTDPGCVIESKKNSLLISNPTDEKQESYVRLGPLYNYAAVDLAIGSQQHAGYTANAVLALQQDCDNRILVVQRAADAADSSCSLEIFKDGKSVLFKCLSDKPVAAPYVLRCHLTGKYLNVMQVKDGDAVLLASVDISAFFDLRDAAFISGFSVLAGARLGHGEQVKITALEQVLPSGTGQADPKVIHDESGAPMIDGDTIWLAMTTRGYGPIPSSYQGVYSYNLKTKEWKVTGAMSFDQGDGIKRPWHASDIFYDRTDRTWKVFTVSHGDDHRIYYGVCDQDPRFGIVEVNMTAADYESVRNEEDPSVFFDAAAGKWRMAVCKYRNGYQTVLLESDRWDGRWEPVSLYEPTSCTGILIQKIGGTRYVFLGRGDSPCPFEVLSYPELKKMGELKLDEHPEGRNVWPVVIPVTRSTGTAYYLLTFDRDGLYEGWSYGKLHWYEATRFATGFKEYAE